MDPYERAYKFFLLVFILSIVSIVATIIFMVVLFSQLFTLIQNPLGMMNYLFTIMVIFMPIIMGISLIQVFMQYSTVKQDIGQIGGDFGLSMKDHERIVKYFKFLPVTVILSFIMVIFTFPMILVSPTNYSLMLILIIPLLIISLITLIISVLSVIGQILLAIYLYNLGRDSGNNLLEIGGILMIFMGFVGTLLVVLGLKQLYEER